MAHFGRDDSFSAARTVQITGSETNENFTSYTIEMMVGSYTWTVKHRYSEFHELHEKLVCGHKVDKGLLPPKKLFGNQTESFVKKRQQDLQLYLQTILNLLALHPPPALTNFLHFNIYEIHGITQTMAEDLYNRGEVLLHSDEVYQVTPLQLHSLTERLKLPEPTCDSGDVRKDLGHILDFITRTRHLKVVGTCEWVGSSTINMNLLPFDLSLFKSLHTLEVENCRFDMVQGLETVKQTLHILRVYHTASTVKEVVLQDVPQWRGEDGSQLVAGWDHVTHVDFSHNFVKHIDGSVEILWRVEHLDLSHNQLEGVQHLQWLSHMTHLNLAHNRLRVLDALHTKLGNLKCLLLQGNQIETLQGFSKLFSLEVLDVSDNRIAKVEDVRPVCQLPCMESLKLTDNPVILTVDYRTRILEMFGDRVGEVSLDGVKASQKEKDTVAVRLALQKARDARTRQAAPRKNSSPAPLCSDMRGGRGQTPPPPTRHSPLPPCSASISSSSALSQAQRAENSQVSTSAPHHSLPRQWSQPSMQHASPAATMTPERTLATQVSAISIPERKGEGAVPPTLIPEAHPFDPTADPSPPPSPTPLTRQEYRVSDLPSITNPRFLTWLHTHLYHHHHHHLPSTTTTTTTISATSSRTGGSSSIGGDPKLVSVLWCYAQFYSSSPSSSSSPPILPCCALLTTSALLLQRLSASAAMQQGEGEAWPGLRACVVLPLKSIQHVVVGPGYSYLRVEEAFVGREGLMTLFALQAPPLMKLFAEHLQDCCTLLDPANPLDVLDLLGQSDLLTEIRHREKKAGLVSDDLAFTLLVRVRGKGGGGEERPGLLVVSENVVYVVDAGCVYWPPATFLSPPQQGVLQLQVMEELSVLEVSDLSVTCPPLLEEGGGRNGVDFCPLPLTLHTQDPASLTVLFSAASSRQAFVDCLNRLRARQGQGVEVLDLPEGSHDTSATPNLADSSSQSCRSRSSSDVVSSEVNHSHLPVTAGEGPAQSVSSLNNLAQSVNGCEDALSAEGPEACGDGLPDDFARAEGRLGHPPEGDDLQVSVEAEVHDVYAASDVQCCVEGEGQAGHDGKPLLDGTKPSVQLSERGSAGCVQHSGRGEERSRPGEESAADSEQCLENSLPSEKAVQRSENAEKCSDTQNKAGCYNDKGRHSSNGGSRVENGENHADPCQAGLTDHRGQASRAEDGCQGRGKGTDVSHGEGGGGEDFVDPVDDLVEQSSPDYSESGVQVMRVDGM